ncbi:ATP-dependent DNA helicase Q1-like [Anopheles nili]|uniref:ATP-dependent DNA helicase Q1-like n=1 Tax=Anopheles nili TaxID=185578 RepID=UPI00237A34FE|nr:ATP-dependent DNA helicase Q1-like [Anopheles nili]
MDNQLSTLNDEELSAHNLQITQKLEVIESKLSRLKSQKAQLIQLRESIQSILHQRKTNKLEKRDWDSETFSWSTKARNIMLLVFSLKHYRQMQLRTINALMDGNDVLLLAPTGSGKSLCFQLPALLSDGITVVISPLISLMEDQVWSLDKVKVKAQLMCSTTDKNTVSRIYKELSDKDKAILKLLYVTPERLSKSKRFMTALQKCYNNGKLDRIAIDEVHCCSQWGHDFRPDYKFLGVLKEMFPKTPLLGVTATATTKVITDVQNMLNIPESLLFVASFNRPNLYYHVLDKPTNKQAQYDLLSNLLLTRFRKQCGIIYTYSMKDAVDISSELTERGLLVAPYHANLEQADRTKIHQLWHNNEVQAVVATIAFGMGINKGNVRFVIHHTLSKSMENFYQESGRAGRDGERAECILLFNFSDIFRISTMTFSEHMGLKNAYALVEYCISTNECRRKLISQYFSEVWGKEDCNNMCDRCANREITHPMMDIAPYLQQLYSIIEQAGQTKLTGLKLVDAWFHKGPVYLRLSKPAPLIDRVTAEQIVAYFIINDYLKESFVYTPYATLSYIDKGRARIEGDSLKIQFGKHFALHDEASTSKSHLRTANQTNKRTFDTSTLARKETINGSKRVKKSSTLNSKTTSRSSNRSQTKSSDEEDVLVLQNNVDVIEIDED